MRHLRYIAATAAAALSYAAAAAEKTAVSGAAAAGGPYSDTATLAGIAQWFVSSIFVVALIFLCAYLARKLRLVPAARAGSPKVLQVLPLGGKHRIAAVEIMNKVLIVGITPAGMTLLAGPFEQEKTAVAGKEGSAPAGGNAAKDNGSGGAPSFRSVLESLSGAGGKNGTECGKVTGRQDG